MPDTNSHKKIDLSKILFVLIGFPLISTLISLLLLNRNWATDLGMDFFHAFWVIIIFWYIAQILIVKTLIKKSNWTWKDIGYTLSSKRTIYLILGYLIFSFGLLYFIEYTLATKPLDSRKMESLVKLTPKNTTARIIFIFLGLVAGISEELVYRGFAISGLMSNKINKWVAVLLAAVPFVLQHGIKAYQINWGTWYFIWGIVFGTMFIFLKKLNANIVIHWLVILSGMVAILQAVAK